MNRKRGFTNLVLGTLCLATIPVVTKVILEDVPSVHFTTTWTTLAGGWALLWTILRRRGSLATAIRTSWRGIFLTGTLATGFVFAYFAGLSRLNPAVATFLINSRMVWAVLIGVLFLGERYRGSQIAAMVVVVAGVIVVYAGAPSTDEFTGMVMIVLAALLFVLINVVVKRSIARVGVTAILLARFVFPALMLLPASISAGTVWPYLTPRVVALLIVGSLIGPFLSFRFIFMALRDIELGIHTMFQSLGIVLTTVFTLAVFGTLPERNDVLGGALIVLGLAALGALSLRRPAATPE